MPPYLHPTHPTRPSILLQISLVWCLLAAAAFGGKPPEQLESWLTPQSWQRDADGPILSLGEAGQFDDTHIFAPAVIRENDRFRMWYCGARGAVSERVFQLGLATSENGRDFARYKDNPVFGFADHRRSVLTPTLLRSPDGNVLREDGRLRMWFSSTDFQDKSGLHTLHETTSDDGIAWSPPSEALLKHVYAPTIIRDGRQYRMWYVDVSESEWIIRHATSDDGRRWRVSPDPCLVVDQAWERSRLFYPTVMKIDGAYLMWYGSYWKERQSTTATGFAASLDGLKWYKHPDNPVLRPDPGRPWETHYVTSQSVMRLPDGRFRIWYASRKKPPFVNKYFAINTAVWKPQANTPPKTPASVAAAQAGPDAFRRWRDQQRRRLGEMLGIPKQRVPLEAERRGQVEWDGIVIEKWVFTSEPGSRVPAVLYRPKQLSGKIPAIVLTFGHGGSKSQWQYNYGGLLYAKLGLACLAMDPIGEEERHRQGRLGTRAHDPKDVSERADRAGRLVMGKLVFDTMRGIDFLLQRDWIDSERIGVAGNSLGGAKAGWMAALEPRIKLAIVSGWAYDDITLQSKYCTRLPNERMREQLSWTDYAALAAPDCAVLLANGDADWVIDKGHRSVWQRTRQVVDEASSVYERLGSPGRIRAWFEAGGGHRPYFAYQASLEWIHQHLGTPAMTLEQIRALPTLNAGEWCDRHKIELERLYGTPLHQRGATLPDLNLRPTPRETLSCLKPGELGSPPFTLEGWLQEIENKSASRSQSRAGKP